MNAKTCKFSLMPHMITFVTLLGVAADFLSNMIFQAQKLYAFLDQKSSCELCKLIFEAVH